MAVLRGRDWGLIAEVGTVLIDAGIGFIEVALTVPDATRAIRRLADAGVGRVGAGTVTSAEDVEALIEAGAGFLVSPTCRVEIAERSQTLGVACILGALTPSEVLNAWEAGADQVKVFPVGRVGGPGYLEDLAGPFPQIPVMASGGIGIDDLPGYHGGNVASVALGALMARPSSVLARDWNAVTAQAKRVLAAYGRSVERSAPQAQRQPMEH